MDYKFGWMVGAVLSVAAIGGCRAEAGPKRVMRPTVRVTAVAPERALKSASVPMPAWSDSPNRLGPKQVARLLETERGGFWEEGLTFSLPGAKQLDPKVARARERGQPVVLRSGSSRRKWVALTIDDGPHPAHTEKLVSILQKLRVPATFFFVGMMAERHPQLVKMVKAAGFTIGNHTFHHVSLPKLNETLASQEIRACDAVLKAVTGEFPVYFRPPGGKLKRAGMRQATQLGHVTVLWTSDPGDYMGRSAEAVTQEAVREAGPGGIILLHDGVDATIQALPLIVRRMQAKGYTFVSLDQLRGVPEAGTVSKP